jgi:pyruvate formate lyase activating enzyme
VTGVRGQTARALRIGGVVPFTTTDFPGKLAAVLFLQGCPWRCGYCHNPHLHATRSSHECDWAQTLRWIERRRGLLDAIVFSGGEPTAQPMLVSAMRTVRRMGFAVGLHSGGAYPRRLAAALPDVDWVGLDLKAPLRDYPAITGKDGSGESAYASLDTVLAAGVRHEIRTTVHPALTSPADLAAMADALAARGVTEWVLQPFRANGCANESLLASAVAGDALDPALLARLARRVPGICVR